jgi:hypothetical protein
MKRALILVLGIAAVGFLVVRWTTDNASLALIAPSAEQARALRSLKKLSDHPLYVMHYCGSYRAVSYSTVLPHDLAGVCACTLFAAAGDPETPVYGRNFDWPRHPALVLIAEPPDAYASVSMVDLSFLFPEDVAQDIHRLPAEQRIVLLEAPLWVFDGMNERGVAIGMAAVADTTMPYDDALETVGSLEIMRRVLDRAASVEEAIDLFESVNVSMSGGPCIHYLVADATGDSALIEYWDGAMHVLRSDESWACAANYRLCLVGEADRAGLCWRYDAVHSELSRTEGSLTRIYAMALLDMAHAEVPNVPEAGTQWSVVYDMKSGHIELAVGHDYGKIFRFQVPASGTVEGRG